MSELRDVGRSYFPSTRRSRLRMWGGGEGNAKQAPGQILPSFKTPRTRATAG